MRQWIVGSGCWYVTKSYAPDDPTAYVCGPVWKDGRKAPIEVEDIQSNGGRMDVFEWMYDDLPKNWTVCCAG